MGGAVYSTADRLLGFKALRAHLPVSALRLHTATDLRCGCCCRASVDSVQQFSTYLGPSLAPSLAPSLGPSLS